MNDICFLKCRPTSNSTARLVPVPDQVILWGNPFLILRVRPYLAIVINHTFFMNPCIRPATLR